MSRRIVVHGASGFIGRHFVRTALDCGNELLIVARGTSKISVPTSESGLSVLRYERSIEELVGNINLDCADSTFYEFSWHGVLGRERDNPQQFLVNIPLTLGSLGFAHSIGVSHWIGLGSQAEYGGIGKRASENDDCRPTTLYGRSKLICSQIAATLCSHYGMRFSWLRLFSTYGPDDNPEWLIPSVINDMLGNRVVRVTAGEQSWDYLYIDDVVEALLRLADSRGVGIANLGSGRPAKVREIVNKIRELSGSESAINFGAIKYREDQLMYMEADISKISKELEWRPRIELDDGLQRTIQFYRNCSDNLSERQMKK